MAKQKSEFVSGMGTGFEIVKKLSEAVAAAGGGDDELRRVLSDKALPPRLAREIMTPVPATYAELGRYTFRKTDFPCGARLLHLGDYAVCREVPVKPDLGPFMKWKCDQIDSRVFTPSRKKAGYHVKLGLLSAGDSRSGREILKLMDLLSVRPASASDLIDVIRCNLDLLFCTSEICEIQALEVEHVDSNQDTFVFGVQRGGFLPVKWLNAGKSLDDMGWGKIVWFLVELSE